MKKFMIIPIALFVFILTGCTVTFKTDDSKVDRFVEVAEKMEEMFSVAESTFKELHEKNYLTYNDHQNIVEKIESLIDSINKFQTTEAPFLVKGAKKKIAKILNEKENNFLKILEKAKKGEVEKGDLEIMIELLSSEIELNIYSDFI